MGKDDTATPSMCNVALQTLQTSNVLVASESLKCQSKQKTRCVCVSIFAGLSERYMSVDWYSDDSCCNPSSSWGQSNALMFDDVSLVVDRDNSEWLGGWRTHSLAIGSQSSHAEESARLLLPTIIISFKFLSPTPQDDKNVFRLRLPRLRLPSHRWWKANRISNALPVLPSRFGESWAEKTTKESNRLINHELLRRVLKANSNRKRRRNLLSPNR